MISSITTRRSTPLATMINYSPRITDAFQLHDGRLLSYTYNKVRIWSADGAPLSVMDRPETWFRLLPLRNGRILSWSFGTDVLHLWSADGAPLAVLRGHRNDISGALELPDGLILSWAFGRFGKIDHWLGLWSPDGELIRPLKGHTDWVTGARVLSDRRILTWSQDGTLRFWESDGRPIGVFAAHEAAVIGASQGSDGTIVSWSDDKIVRRWSPDGALLAQVREEQHVLGAFTLNNGPIVTWSRNTLAYWSPDGAPIPSMRYLLHDLKQVERLTDVRIVVSANHRVRIWTAEGIVFDPLVVYPFRDVRFRLLHGGERLLTWSLETLHIWDVRPTPAYRPARVRHTSAVSGLHRLNDGRVVSHGVYDNRLYVWGRDGELSATFAGHNGPCAGALALMHEGEPRILSWTHGGAMRLWKPDGMLIAALDANPDGWGFGGVIALPDGRILTYARETIQLWTANGEPIASLHGHLEQVHGVRQLTDGRLLSWDTGGKMWLWQADGAPIAELNGHRIGLGGALELTDGRLASWTGWSDRRNPTLRVWTGDGQSNVALNDSTDVVWRAVARPDGGMITWSHDTTFRLWSADLTPITVQSGHSKRLDRITVLADGRLLSLTDKYAYKDFSPRLWTPDGELIAVLHGHTQRVYGVLLLDDGRFVSWSDDGTLRVWDRKGRALAVLQHDYPITACVPLSAQRIICGDGDGRVFFVDLFG